MLRGCASDGAGVGAARGGVSPCCRALSPSSVNIFIAFGHVCVSVCHVIRASVLGRLYDCCAQQRREGDDIIHENLESSLAKHRHHPAAPPATRVVKRGSAPLGGRCLATLRWQQVGGSCRPRRGGSAGLGWTPLTTLFTRDPVVPYPSPFLHVPPSLIRVAAASICQR